MKEGPMERVGKPMWPKVFLARKIMVTQKSCARCKDIMDKNQTKWDKLAAKIASKKK